MIDYVSPSERTAPVVVGVHDNPLRTESSCQALLCFNSRDERLAKAKKILGKTYVLTTQRAPKRIPQRPPVLQRRSYV